MKVVKVISLREGDWIILKPDSYLNKKGKFEICKVKEFRVEFDKVIKIDMNEKTSKEDKNCYIDFESDSSKIWKINKKELEDIKLLNKKIKIVDSLSDDK